MASPDATMKEAVGHRPTLVALLDRLEHNGDLLDREAAERALQRRDRQDEMPIYLRMVVGVGAFIAALTFIGFLALADLIDFGSCGAMAAWGLGFVAVAIGLHRFASGRADTLVLAFLVQSSFFAMMAGKILVTMGLATALEWSWAIPLGAAMVTAATYHAYPLEVDRFLSTFSIGFAVLVLLFVDRDVLAVRSVLFNVFVVAQLAVAGQLLVAASTNRAYLPLARGLLVSLAASMVLVSVQSELGWRHPTMSPLPVNVVLAMVLVAVIGWVAGGAQRLRSEPLIIACAGVAVLALVSTPGVLLAIGLLVFGHARHRWFELVLGALLLPTFIFAYYYSLDLDLAGKAATLVASGAVLLAGRGYLRVRGLDREI